MNRWWLLWLAVWPGWGLAQDADSARADSTGIDVRSAASLRTAAVPGQGFQGTIRYQVRTKYTGKHAAEYQRDSSQYPTRQLTEVHPAGIRMAAWGPLFRSTVLRPAGAKQYVLDSVNRVAWEAPAWRDTLTIVPQAKRETILGYATRLYHVVAKTARGAKPRVYQQIWLADSLRPAPGFELYPGLRGLPLRIITQDPVPFRNQPGTFVTVTVEATAVDQVPLPEDRFRLPSDWTVKPWDPLVPLGGMGGDRQLAPNGMPRGGGATGNSRE